MATSGPLIKISKKEGTTSTPIFKFIRAETLEHVLERGQKKLSLPEGQYKVFLDDGTEIDDDDIFSSLITQSTDPLKIFLIDHDANFNDSISTQISEQGQEDITQNTNARNIYDDLVSSIPKSCTTFINGRASDDQSKRLVRYLTDFFMNESEDKSLTAVKKASLQICNKYPEYRITIGGVPIVNDSHMDLVMKAYESISYQKKVAKRKADNNGDTSVISKKFKQTDQYGCAEGQFYSVISKERLQILDSQRVELFEHFNDGILCTHESVKLLIEETYDLQRHDIVGMSQKTIETIFSEWPYLKEYTILLQHANRLLGTNNIQTCWNDSLKRWARHTRRFLEVNEYAKIVNDKSKISKNEPLLIKNLVEEAEKIKENEGHGVALISVIFTLVVMYFKEEQNLLYIIVDENNDKEEVCTNATPTLIVKGKSLYDEKAEFYVAIEKKNILKVSNVSNGILLVLLSYYIFNLAYPEDLTKTLEFFQRFYLNIDSSGAGGGNKKGGTKRKKQPTSYNRKAMKLITDITKFAMGN